MPEMANLSYHKAFQFIRINPLRRTRIKSRLQWITRSKNNVDRNQTTIKIVSNFELVINLTTSKN